MTPAELLRQAAETLRAAGVDAPARDARWLLEAARGGSVAAVDAIAPETAERFAGMVAARAARQPVSQIIGWREFWGRRFEVTADVLDPRPETETIIELALANGPRARVLDLGTGSGCLGLTLAAEWPGAEVTLTDISQAALEVAGRNSHRLGVADRVHLCRADWFDGLSGRFDLILCNPPYIPEDEIAELAPEVRDWEPRTALTPGGDGLDAYRALAAGLPRFLAPKGLALLETGLGQPTSVSSLMAHATRMTVAIHSDMTTRERVVSVTSHGNDPFTSAE